MRKEAFMSEQTVTGKAFDGKLLKRVYAFVKPYKKIFYISIFLTLSLAVIAPLRPWLIQKTIDGPVATRDINSLPKMLVLLLALLLIQTLVQYWHTLLTNSLGQSVIKDMRVKLFAHITSLRHKYFDQTPIGTLVTRNVSDLETIADIFSEGLIVIIGDLLQLSVIIGFMFYSDWRLTLISLSTLPILFVATNIFKNGIKNAFRDVRTQVARLNTFVQEHITGMQIVQIFNREEEEMKRFKKINRSHANANIRSVWYYSIFFPVVEILSAVSIGLVVWYGAKGVIAENISIGLITAFIMYINMLFRPIRELADKFNTLQMGMVSAERVFKVLDTQEHIANNGTFSPTTIHGKVEFKNVWFAYNDEQWVLKDVSFTVLPGQMVALVGATGSGKSSVINLVSRNYEFQKGQILIDDVDIRSYDVEVLRSKMAMVMQDVFLFTDTISNNISMKDERISQQEIEEASRQIGAHSFISQLPGGYQYNVMERGSTLSTGQRQLISFIRAYVVKPHLLILDEATSNIDTESEQVIQEATEKLTANRTSIVVAHRLSTIQHANKIMVFDHGVLKEQGSHEELLQHDGLYKQLYEIQFERSV